MVGDKTDHSLGRARGATDISRGGCGEMDEKESCDERRRSVCERG
jgi:hypothetical protein